jgi:hypothetical protein
VVRVPRARIAHTAPARARTGTSELLRQILRRDLREELILVPATQDIDLRYRHRVEPALDEVPYRGEAPWRIDDIELAHALRVAILPDGARCVHVIFHLVERAEGDVGEVEDRAGRLDGVTHLGGGGRETVGEELFVLVDELFEHTVLGSYGVEGFDVELADLLDVHGTAVLGWG